MTYAYERLESGLRLLTVWRDHTDYLGQNTPHVSTVAFLGTRTGRASRSAQSSLDHVTDALGRQLDGSIRSPLALTHVLGESLRVADGHVQSLGGKRFIAVLLRRAPGSLAKSVPTEALLVGDVTMQLPEELSDRTAVLGAAGTGLPLYQTVTQGTLLTGSRAAPAVSYDPRFRPSASTKTAVREALLRGAAQRSDPLQVLAEANRGLPHPGIAAEIAGLGMFPDEVIVSIGSRLLRRKPLHQFRLNTSRPSQLVAVA